VNGGEGIGVGGGGVVAVEGDIAIGFLKFFFSKGAAGSGEAVWAKMRVDLE
jgi:hypothetical protein